MPLFMKHGKFEIKKPLQPKDSNAFTLYQDGIPVTPLCFGTYEAAFNFFKKHMGIGEPEKQDEVFAEPVIEQERTVGNYSNSGYINLMKD
jgi:hypothetical protein